MRQRLCSRNIATSRRINLHLRSSPTSSSPNEVFWHMSAIRRPPLEIVKPQLRPAAISVESVSKLFGHDEERVTALDNIDLAIGAGEFVAIVGPSRCGKST